MVLFPFKTKRFFLLLSVKKKVLCNCRTILMALDVYRLTEGFMLIERKSRKGEEGEREGEREREGGGGGGR